MESPDKILSGKPSGSVSTIWPLLWWFLGSLCVPVTVPYILYQIIMTFRWKRLRTRLLGKVVLITGASSGLGEALAHVFYKSGCRIILAARRKEELDRVRNDLLQTHSTAPTHPPVVMCLDLSDLNSMNNKANEALAIHGRIDILINNGGISFRGEVLTTSVDVDVKVMVVNYFGQVALTKAIVPSMIKEGGGHVVAVSSIQGRISIPFRSVYAASKHALQAFCDSLRAEVEDRNVKVTVISPGYIQTNLSLNALTGKGTKYGVMDSNTATGFPPMKVAEEILKSVVLEKREVMISTLSPKLATWIRTVFPSLYFWIMKNRAQRLRKESSKQD